MARGDPQTYLRWKALDIFYIPVKTEILSLLLEHSSNIIIKKAFLMFHQMLPVLFNLFSLIMPLQQMKVMDNILLVATKGCAIFPRHRCHLHYQFKHSFSDGGHYHITYILL